MQHPVVWFEVLGNDESKLNRFYSELFGWKIDAQNPMRYGMVDTGTKKGIPGGIGPTSAGARPGVTFYVASDDLDASLERAKQLGGRVVLPPTQKKGGPLLALFEDPEGHLIGLVKPLPDQPSA
ncbi:MAG: VOC family protein [Myxococcota bacterium]